MRVLLAGLFVFVVTLAVVGVIGSHYPGNNLPWWALPAILITFFSSMIACFLLFNMIGHRLPPRGKSAAEQMAELESKGLLASESFLARRAFQVEEIEDEGSHYFVELADDSVLYLNGQYLYEYEEIIDDPEFNQKRTFPCTEFTLRRHKTSGEVLDLVCAGVVLPIDCEAPPFDSKDFKRSLIPEDGQLIRGRSYDDLKRERLKGGPEG